MSYKKHNFDQYNRKYQSPIFLESALHDKPFMKKQMLMLNY